ncbi:hypothetical protein [Methylobacterium tarhaniae]|uniref:hypothetical protein n=1 Tax=Methylobacterium tarhaniae TaxID=1187852 RepID=UPI003D004CCD
MNTYARHRWFDEWQGAATPRLRRLVEEATALVAQYEREAGSRVRDRRPDDLAHYLTAIEVLVSNLAYAVLIPPPTGRLALLTGNGNEGCTRYDNRAFGRPFRTLLDTFEGIGWLSRERGYRDRQGGVASSIAPTPLFASKVHEASVSLSDFGRIEGEELIILKRKVTADVGHSSRKELVNYPETSTTTSLRDTMRGFNSFLAGADISFLDDGLGAVDLHNRIQRRHFLIGNDDTPSCSLGGRLYGGAWQNLPRSRRASIRIGGEPIVVLDFSAMAPRLAYASVGATPPTGDIYALPGLDTVHRPAVKKAFNTLLCDTFIRKRGWPEPDDGDPRLPPSWTVPRFRAALLDRHPALLPCLGTGMAPQLQNTESTILMEVLSEMRIRGIPVLSLHDGLFCPGPQADDVKRVMEGVALAITSAHVPVGVQPVAATTKNQPNNHIQEP